MLGSYDRHEPLSVQYNGLELNGLGRYGFWEVDNLEGWFTRPALRSTDSENPAGGDYRGTMSPGPRLVTITGAVALEDRRDRPVVLDLLTGLADRQERQLVVTLDGSTSWAMARQGDDDITPEVQGLLITYTLLLKASDPRRYGGWQAPVFLGSDVRTEGIFHRGNADSPPVLRVSGSAPGGYTITHEDGQGFEVHAPLVSGRPHIVDFATVRAYDNGAPLSDYGQAKQILIHKGMPQAMRIRPNTTGSVTAELEVQDVWL